MPSCFHDRVWSGWLVWCHPSPPLGAATQHVIDEGFESAGVWWGLLSSQIHAVVANLAVKGAYYFLGEEIKELDEECRKLFVTTGAAELLDEARNFKSDVCDKVEDFTEPVRKLKEEKEHMQVGNDTLAR
eukprot:975960-Pyramimonas_sp.AAC.1